MRRMTRQSASVFDEPIVNLTPLIDVVFVVLIMFIVVAPLLEMEEVALADGTPKASMDLQQLQKGHPISITVKHDNTIWLNGRIVTPEVLQSLCREAKGNYPRATPLLFHDKKASFGTYQSVKGAVERAGYQELDVVLRPG
jgi:biopolymer transport protein ExbD